MSLELLKKSLLLAPVIKRGDYPYVIHPITDGIPFVNPDLLNEVILEMKRRIEKVGSFDKIVTIEAMGIPLATALSLKLKKPYLIIRKRSYNLQNEHIVFQKTGYSKSNLYINGLKKGDKIIIVDDVLSTGGTLSSILLAFNEMGIVIKGVFIAINKGNSIKKIEEEYSIKINCLINIDIIEEKVIIKQI